MLSMVLLALQTATAPDSAPSPPPPPAAAQVPPTVESAIVPPRRPRPPAEPAVNQVAHVTILSGRSELWKGQLHLSSNGSASFTQTRRESYACTGDPGRRAYESEIENLNFSIRGATSARQQGYTISVSWKRPLDRNQTDGCQDMSERSVALRQTVDIQPGKSIRLDGDAGLAVTILLRPD